MNLDLIVIDVPELGERVYVSRERLFRLLYENNNDLSIVSATQPAHQEPQPFIIDLLEARQYSPIITDREKRLRMRRGWRPYSFKPIAPATVPVRIQLKTGSPNIGCRNFRKCH